MAGGQLPISVAKGKSNAEVIKAGRDPPKASEFEAKSQIGSRIVSPRGSVVEKPKATAARAGCH
jgi:hypothetical protein